MLTASAEAQRGAIAEGSKIFFLPIALAWRSSTRKILDFIPDIFRRTLFKVDNVSYDPKSFVGITSREAKVFNGV